MANIGFIGVGVMGLSMVRNLMKGGHTLYLYTRTREKAEPALAEGAVWCDSVAECARGRDAVITIVGFPKDVEQVYFGEGGIIANADEGTMVIDMTTTSPKLACRIYEEAAAKGLRALDAPVSGGDTGARKGTLSIMVGGDEDAFEAAKPLFALMGTNIVRQGAAGAGQHAKMANQIAIAGTVAGVCEALAYAKRMQLDPETLLASIGGGAAASWQLANNGPKMTGEDYDPGFYIKHFIKDMAIAQEEGRDVQLEMPVLDTVLELYRQLEAEGRGDLGTQGLYLYYNK